MLVVSSRRSAGEFADGGNSIISSAVCGRFLSPCALAPADPVQRLLEGVGREHAEDDRDAGGQRDLLDPRPRLAGHVVEVRRVAPDHRAEADHRVAPPGVARCCATSGSSNAPGTQCTGTSSSAEIAQRVERALEQSP